MNDQTHSSPAQSDPDELVVRASPPTKSAYRKWFAQLYPPLQLVFLQLWLPVFMCVMFILCYVGGFQHIAPHHVPIGVVGPASTAEAYQQAADAHAPGAFDFTEVADDDTAGEAVRTGALGLAYDVGTNTIFIASAHQAQAASTLPTMVTPLLAAPTTPTRQDVAPLPSGDIGMTPMYLMLAWCISGYLAAMFIGLMGAPLLRRTRFLIITGVGAGLSLLASVLVGPVLHAVTGHFFALWGLGFCWIAVIGAAVNGLSYFTGRFIAAPAMTIFIFLSIPASGAAMPQWLIGEPFHWLNHVVVGSGITEMLKRLIYGVGPGYQRGWIMMLGYLVAGSLLSWVGPFFWKKRRIAALLAGRTTMFQDAQKANGRIREQENTQILSDFGLSRRADGALVHIDHYPTPTPPSPDTTEPADATHPAGGTSLPADAPSVFDAEADPDSIVIKSLEPDLPAPSPSRPPGQESPSADQ